MSEIFESENLASFKSRMLYSSVLRSLKPFFTRSRLDAGVFVLVTQSGLDPDDFEDAIEAIGTSRRTGVPASEFKYVQIKSRAKRDSFARAAIAAVAGARLAYIVTDDFESLPDNLRLVADHVIQLLPVSEWDLITACKSTLDLNITKAQAKALLRYNLDDIAAALRPGRSVTVALERLGSLSTSRSRGEGTETPPLEQMAGYGSAQAWGLQLSRDLADWRRGRIDWSEVDRGLLLSGPPGCGKTIYATSLAKTCGANLIATSAAQWQAHGHLGDLLKAMRASFNTAASKTPAILFIDEIDSIGNRRSFSGDNKAYSVQVVNALLECLDGVVGREGVVVIGASNFPDNLDPALTRAGRLDKHVTIPLPDAEARLTILRQHLGADVSLDMVDQFSARTEGLSGADLSQIARDARRLARIQRRQLALSDVITCLPQLYPLSKPYRRSLAVHEAGHTVVGLHVNVGEFLQVSISTHVNPSLQMQKGGQAAFRYQDIGHRDRQYYLNQVCFILAGIAAEKLVLGSFGDGAAIGEQSDLQRATTIAALIEASFGMGPSLVKIDAKNAQEWQKVLQADASLSSRVNALLQAELAKAMSILEERRPFLDLLTDELERLGTVSPEHLAELSERPAFLASVKKATTARRE